LSVWDKIRKITYKKIYDIFINFVILSLLYAVVVIWLLFLFFQMLFSIFKQDFSVYPFYAQITLTLFGFTLLGNIFTPKDKDGSFSTEKHELFTINIWFLVASICFLIVYAGSNMLPIVTAAKDMNWQLQLLSVIIIGAFSFGLVFLVLGSLVLLFFLTRLHKKIIEQEKKISNSRKKPKTRKRKRKKKNI